MGSIRYHILLFYMHYPLSGWSVPVYVFLECISLLLLVHIATKSMTRVPGFSLGRAHRAYSQLILKPINLLSGCWLGCLTPHQSSWVSVRQHQLYLWLAGDSPHSKNKQREKIQTPAFVKLTQNKATPCFSCSAKPYLQMKSFSG